ncbi:MAG TPA: hypothetical protein VFE42_14025 [Chloroflexota bacterium]|nr:hypothetical protein [Chloroflexota bacterium]
MMENTFESTQSRSLTWLPRAIAAGALASLVDLLLLLIAYSFAAATGSNRPGAGTIANWLYHLTNNRMTNLVTDINLVRAVGLHLAAGMIWALVYAVLVEPRLTGPGWRKGLIFASVPCLISLFILLPLLGAGVFGADLGTGPLAGLGIIFLHAVYGFIMGEFYEPAVSGAVAAGFLASILSLLVMMAAYGFASAVGTTDPNAGALHFALWAYNLANNRVTTLVSTVHLIQAIGLHLTAGVLWAFVYAAFAEPRLRGPGWLRGLIFAIFPCLLSLFVLLPLLNAGFFGLDLGAGPLPGIGVVLLHAVYGAAMGEFYALEKGQSMLGSKGSVQAKAFTIIEGDMTAGIVGGAVLGTVVGVIVVLAGLGTAQPILTIAGAATEGGIAGFVVGIFIGLITA